MTRENRILNAKSELETAQDELHGARLLLEGGHYRMCVSRAYYAVFHGARALLMAEGLQAKTHAGVGAMLNQHFIQNGRISSGFSPTLARMQLEREVSDYRAGAAFTREHAEASLQEAEAFDQAARGWLQQEGFEI